MILSRRNSFLLAATAFVIISITLAIMSWYRTIEMSLPLPTYLPAVNVPFTILTFIALPISHRLDSALKKKMVKTISPYLISASTLALFTFFILSLVYAVPSDMQSCVAERQWLRMYMNKNEIAIRHIQSRLRCCGYNSMRDRAWPFPGNGVDARVCERTQGYFIACGGLWRQEQQGAAALSASASFLNWILVMLVSNYSVTDGQIQLGGPESRLEAGEGQTRRIKQGPTRSTNRSTSVDNHRHSEPDVERSRDGAATADQSTDSNTTIEPQIGASNRGSGSGITRSQIGPVHGKGSEPKTNSTSQKPGPFNVGAKDFVPR